MSVLQTWAQYVRHVAGAKATHADIAAKTGGKVSSSTAGRWLRGELLKPEADHAIEFAKAYRRSPIDALAVAGYLNDVDVSPTARTPLSEYGVDELLEELRRRTQLE